MEETLLSAEEILRELSSPAIQRTPSKLWFSTDLKKLKNSISTIKSVLVLLDAEEEKTTNHEVMKDWLNKLKPAMKDADDVIDDLSTQDLRDKKVRVFFRPLNRIAFRYKMSRKVRKIRERLHDIAEDWKKFQFLKRRAENKKRKERETSRFVPNEIIGRESDKNAILERLLNSDFQEDVVVVPIVGIGGLGKTTHLLN